MKKCIMGAALLALFALGIVAIVGCGGDKVPAGAIAKVGDKVVTQEQFDEIWNQAETQYKNQEGAPPFPEEGTAEYNQLKASIVNYLVQNELVSQKATEMDISVKDKEIQKRMNEIIEQVGGQKKLDKLLKEQSVTQKELESQLKAQMLQDEVKMKVSDDVKVSEEEMKKYFDENAEQFNVPESAEARHVLLKTKADATKVAALLQADNSDGNWKKVAKEYSTDPGSKNSGGELGDFPKGRMVPEFEKVAFSIDLDTVSEPVKSQFGWHVIEVTGKTPGSKQTFEEAKATIEQQLKFQKQSTAWEDWLKQAEKDAKIKYAAGFDPAPLTASPSPAASTAPSPAPTE